MLSLGRSLRVSTLFYSLLCLVWLCAETVFVGLSDMKTMFVACEFVLRDPSARANKSVR